MSKDKELDKKWLQCLHYQEQSDTEMKIFIPEMERITKEDMEFPICGRDAVLCRMVLHAFLARLFMQMAEASTQTNEE